ncbi:MAG: metalloregulator ArsR/SmtB family transcription factor [Gammaproteobacteria bacterium]|nr:metalloregulator ArsR/SmtB family transcription factor [Gammaproteobacteria bacterium]
MNEPEVLMILSAMSQQTRLRIIRYLVRCGAEGACAGDIGAHVAAASSRASFHLAALERAGIITSQRRSRSIIYRAELARLGGVISYLLHDCCAGHPDVWSCCAPDAACC